MEFDPTINYANLPEKTDKKSNKKTDIDDNDMSEMMKLMDEIDKKEDTPVDKSKKDDAKEEIDDGTEREKIILIINRYKNSTRFAKSLKELKLDKLDFANMNMKKLNGLLDKIRFTVDNSQNNDLINAAVFAGIGAIEKIASNLQIAKLDGLSQSLMGNEVFLDSIETIKIESYIFLRFQDPKKRLLFELIKSMYMTNIINTIKQIMGNINGTGENIDIFKAEK